MRMSGGGVSGGKLTSLTIPNPRIMPCKSNQNPFQLPNPRPTPPKKHIIRHSPTNIHPNLSHNTPLQPLRPQRNQLPKIPRSTEFRGPRTFRPDFRAVFHRYSALHEDFEFADAGATRGASSGLGGVGVVGGGVVESGGEEGGCGGCGGEEFVPALFVCEV